MSDAFPSDVQQLINAYVANGSYSTEADVLRDALRALAEEDEDLAAVRAAVRGLANGDPGVPLKEAFDRVRQSNPRTAAG